MKIEKTVNVQREQSEITDSVKTDTSTTLKVPNVKVERITNSNIAHIEY